MFGAAMEARSSKRARAHTEQETGGPPAGEDADVDVPQAPGPNEAYTAPAAKRKGKGRGEVKVEHPKGGKGKGKGRGAAEPPKGKGKGKGNWEWREGGKKDKNKGKGKGGKRDKNQGKGKTQYQDRRQEDEAWRFLASHEAAVQRHDAACSVVVWLPQLCFEEVEKEAQEWEEAKHANWQQSEEAVLAEGADGLLQPQGHPWGCSKTDARTQKLCQCVGQRLFDEAVDGPDDDDSHLKLRPLEGDEQYAPSAGSPDTYINTLKSAPSVGMVVDFALMKGRGREPKDCPFRLTFSNDPWGSFLQGFLLNLQVTPTGEKAGWGIQRWRAKRT